MKKYALYLGYSLPLTAALIAIAALLTADKNVLVEILIRILVFAYVITLVGIADVILYLLALKKYPQLPYTFGFFYLTFLSVLLGAIFVVTTISEGMGEWRYTIGGVLTVIGSILMTRQLPSPKNK